jgi:hypothetical protein
MIGTARQACIREIFRPLQSRYGEIFELAGLTEQDSRKIS